MKTTIKIFTISLLAACVTLQSCKKDEVIEQTHEELFLEKINKAWTVTSVMMDGKDVSKSFPGLNIAITDTKQIIVINAVPPIWKGTSTFQLEPVGDTYQLKRDDGVLITVTEPSDKKLILKFQYAAAARISSVSGEFIFEFTTP
jgi:hypothetical protein